MLISPLTDEKNIRVFVSFFCLLVFLAHLVFVTVLLSRTSGSDSTKQNGKNEPNVAGLSYSASETHIKAKSQTSFGEADFNIQELLAPFVKDSMGRVLNIEFKTNKNEPDGSKNVLDIVYRKPSEPFKEVLEFNSRLVSIQPSAKRFVYVYQRYWEQLTMNTRALMALASQAKIGGRYVVEPRVKDSSFGVDGLLLSSYFNVTHMNDVLEANGYASLVKKDEFDRVCSINTGARHVILHFLYEHEKAKSFLKKNFGLTDEQYVDIRKKAMKSGWTECGFLMQSLPLPVDSKQYCVDPAVVTDWEVLEQGILRDVQCLGILVWRGIGPRTRTSFEAKHVKISPTEIHFMLKLSSVIQNEAKRFQESQLSERYVAIHVRGEKVVLFHNFARLKKCLRVLVNVVEVAKKCFGITKVFLATDMSNFGSGSWRGSLRRESYDQKVLKTLQADLIIRTGALVYQLPADWQRPDRGTVSLIEMSLIAQAQHLFTVGTGSFQEWAVNKFLKFHREAEVDEWSLTRLCSSAS